MLLTRKEAEAIIARCLTEIRETLKNSEPWNDIPEGERVFCAGANDSRAWAFVLKDYGNEVISVDA